MLVLESTVLQADLVLDKTNGFRIDRSVYTELGRGVKMEIPGSMGALGAAYIVCPSR